MVELELSNWKKDNGHESSYSNNMVTKNVVAYKKDNKVVILTKTKVEPGWSVEIYETPNKRLLDCKFNVDEEELEETVKDFLE